MKNNFKLAICQLKVVDDKKSNINRALEMIRTSAKDVELVILPEMFNCPYDSSKFREYAENEEESYTLKAISKSAIDNNVSIIAGSIPEVENDKIYNSCFIFNNDGEITGKYRKIHLFNIETPEIRFKESDTLNAGNQIGFFNLGFIKIGIAICYDMRFPELLRLMALNGAQLIVIPGAFNMTTGPAHWEILIRSRAVDNQLFIAAASPARNEELSYVAYGNSMVADPWGEVIVRAGKDEEIIYADINFKKLKEVRKGLPLLKNRRADIYDLIEK